MTKRRVVAGSIAALLVIIVIIVVVIARQRVRRHPYFRAAPAAKVTPPPTTKLASPQQWTEQFRALEVSGRWSDLAKLLDQAVSIDPRLAYLRARAYVESNEKSEALRALQPFLANGNPFRDLALYHASEVEEGAAASRDRQALIFGYPTGFYRDEAIDDEIVHLSSRGDVSALAAFAARLYPAASTARRRDLDAHLVELLARRDVNAALQKGLALLRGGTVDDPADRTARALDRPDLIRRMNADQQATLGEAMQNHRHFDRAIALLSLALRALPQKREELQFAIGRSWFGDEKYAQAQQVYMTGASATRDARWKATFLWHASRCAQLRGDDATAERLMTAAAGVPGKFASASAAITQRLRTRIKQHRFAEAGSDLAAIRKIWPKDHAVVEASLAHATGMIGAGNNGAGIVTLNAIPRGLLDKFEPSEIDYWRARALENSNPSAAFAAYLNVLRASMPTHFAYFARQRLDSQAMAPRLARELAVRDAQVPQLFAAKSFELARRVQTDRILLSSSNHAVELQRLRQIYEQIPAYRAVLELKPTAFPHFPLPPNVDRMSLLMAMGLFDEAADDVMKRFPLRPQSSALTRSYALNLGNASKDSIFAVEVLMKSVPNDYMPELLPMTIRQLLYPRYFWDYVASDSQHFGADPTLVMAIMREESRFNPRAKSEAAARGLMQFIITTAKDIGRDVGLVSISDEDLYDPRVIIRLGAKYVSTLSKQFANNGYATAGAYNAGPNQVALWQRLSPGAGDDFFLSSINFDETKQYVRKVMNSYKRYAEIYGNAGPQGGVRIEP